MARSRSSRKHHGNRGGRIKFALWFNGTLAVVIGVWFLLQPSDRRAEVQQLVGSYLAREKHIRLADVAWDLYQLYYSDAFVRAAPPQDRNQTYAGEPRSTSLPWPIRVLHNKAYTVGYCDALGSAVWVAYHVPDVRALRAPPTRPDRFEVDRRTTARVASEDFSNSGYDRGHLAPNYAIATRFGESAQRETFLMSNIVPQRHELNAGRWKDLELRAATSYPGRFSEIWIVVGPIFEPQPKRLRNAAIPQAFYMIIVDESGGAVRAEAFIFAQNTPPDSSLAQGLSSIDEVERRTGLDFFSELEDSAEARLESKRAERVW